LKKVKIGNKLIGDGEPCFIIAEIGINHNGDINIAKKLIEASALANCQAVKFQKRTIDIVYSPEELSAHRISPYGETNGDLKYGLEFGKEEYGEIDSFSKKNNIIWFASCWDEQSVDFIEQFNPPCYKIASASLTDDNLLMHHKSYNRPIILSTGMSTVKQIDHAVDVLGTDNLIILHCTSTYPSKNEELNLSVIYNFKEKYGVPIGYSGHEVGLATSVASTVFGACIIERHITLDRTMWGSDQAASVEPYGFNRLVRDVRAVEEAIGDGEKVVYESEKPIIDKLRRK